jgi:isopenicillin N synthase-like dioxygenase
MKRRVFRLYEPEKFQENEKEIKEMCQELSKYGYFYSEIPKDLYEAGLDVMPVSEKFFKLPLLEKMNFSSLVKRKAPLNPKTFKQPENREFYDVRQIDFETMNDENFIKPTRYAFNLYEYYSKLFMKQICFGINADNDYVESTYGDSISTLRLLHYYQTEEPKLTCNPHSDMGYITLAVCFDSGLEIKELDSHKYFDAEKNAPQEKCMIIFAGETLARISGGYFKSPIHRVISQKERYSLPFFFRGRNDAILDVKKLKSDILMESISLNDTNLMKPMSVEKLYELTHQQYSGGVFNSELGFYKKDDYWKLE